MTDKIDRHWSRTKNDAHIEIYKEKKKKKRRRRKKKIFVWIKETNGNHPHVHPSDLSMQRDDWVCVLNKIDKKENRKEKEREI